MKENHKATLNYIREILKASNYSDDEKKYFSDLLPIMSEDKLRELISLITLEKDLKDFNQIMMLEYAKI